MNTRIRFVALLISLAAVSAFAEETRKTPDITLVLWSANDCHFCASWKGSLGGKGDLLKWEGFGAVTYVEVERVGIRSSYQPEDFPSNMQWLRENGRASMSIPAWSIYVDGVRVASSVGLRSWDRETFPKLKEIVAAKAGIRQ